MVMTVKVQEGSSRKPWLVAPVASRLVESCRWSTALDRLVLWAPLLDCCGWRESVSVSLSLIWSCGNVCSLHRAQLLGASERQCKSVCLCELGTLWQRVSLLVDWSESERQRQHTTLGLACRARNEAQREQCARTALRQCEQVNGSKPDTQQATAWSTPLAPECKPRVHCTEK